MEKLLFHNERDIESHNDECTMLRLVVKVTSANNRIVVTIASRGMCYKWFSRCKMKPKQRKPVSSQVSVPGRYQVSSKRRHRMLEEESTCYMRVIENAACFAGVRQSHPSTTCVITHWYRSLCKQIKSRQTHLARNHADSTMLRKNKTLCRPKWCSPL